MQYLVGCGASKYLTKARYVFYLGFKNGDVRVYNILHLPLSVPGLRLSLAAYNRFGRGEVELKY